MENIKAVSNRRRVSRWCLLTLLAVFGAGCSDTSDPTSAEVTEVTEATEGSESAIRAWTPAKLAYASGSNQTAAAGGRVPSPITARVTDWRGVAQAGVPVSFTVAEGGGSVGAARVNTDAQGYASTTWTLGSSSTQRVVADAKASGNWSLQSQSVAFTATASGATTPPPEEPPPATGTAPGAVTNLRVNSTTESAVRLRWTAVSDGTGAGAKYAIRVGSPGIVWADAYQTEREVPAVAPGEVVSYSYTGLPAGTNYQFQVVSYRGTLNQNAVFGPRSNIASGTTTSGTTAPDTIVRSVTASVASRTFTQIGETFQVTATARNAAGQAISSPNLRWTSSNTSIASVDNVGRIRANAAGTAMIIVASVCCGPADTVTANVDTGTQPPPPPPPSSGTPFFEDNFDAGKRNANGFSWTDHNDGVSVVNGALRFRFGPNGPDEDDTAEQRFQLSTSASTAPTEVWLQYRWYVPANYVHRSGNNKFMTLWAEDYSGSRDAQFYLSLESRSGSTALAIIAIHGDDPRYPSNTWVEQPNFVTSADRGKWMDIRIHAKLSTSGVIEVWKNGVLHVAARGYNMVYAGGTRNYYRHGYLMGWSNSGYAQQTDFLIDDFKIYRTNPGW